MIRATWVQTGEDFDIGPDVNERSQELIARLHRQTSKKLRPGRELVECREHDPELPELWKGDERVHGIYVALVKRRQGTTEETWTVAHVDGRAGHTINVGKGWRHQREQDEWCAAASTAGWPVDQEVGVSNGSLRRVCDVLIEGSAGRYDIEVEHRRSMTVPGAKGRVTNLRKCRVEPVFSTDHLTPWNEINAIPNIRTNDLRDALSAIRPVRDEWRVVGGVRSVYAEQCLQRYGSVCPDRGPGRFCGREHPRLEPLQLRAYEVAERLPAGDLVVVRLGPLGEVIMSAADRELYAGLGGLILPPPFPGAVTEPLPTRPARDSECAPLSPEAVERLIARHDDGVGSSNWPIFRRGPAAVYLCQRCGWASLVMADGLCMRCRRALGMDARPR